MNNDQLSTLLGTCIIPMVAEELEVPDDKMADFLDEFYRSPVYDTLIQEETAAWHLSATTLAGIYTEERENGNLEWPEEQ